MLTEKDFCYPVGVKDGKIIVLSYDEIIQNALYQESEGVKPSYSLYDYEKKERITPRGWLVWSSMDYGCGVVYRNKKGKMCLVRGVQGDFAVG